MSSIIREKTDIKLLILYVLSKLPAPIEEGELFEICRCDEGAGWFDWSACLGELVSSGNAAEEDWEYFITEKGRKNAETLTESLPRSVRRAADEAIAPQIARLQKKNLIKAEVLKAGEETRIRLSLSDGLSDIMKLELLCPEGEYAGRIRRNFKKDPQKYYNKILDLMLDLK